MFDAFHRKPEPETAAAVGFGFVLGLAAMGCVWLLVAFARAYGPTITITW